MLMAIRVNQQNRALFAFPGGRPTLARRMPKNFAEITGVIVCAIVTFGADLDITYAMLLGIAAGALAIFFVSLAEAKGATRR